jgi:hypothetical protein
VAKVSFRKTVNQSKEPNGNAENFNFPQYQTQLSQIYLSFSLFIFPAVYIQKNATFNFPQCQNNLSRNYVSFSFSQSFSVYLCHFSLFCRLWRRTECLSVFFWVIVRREDDSRLSCSVVDGTGICLYCSPKAATHPVSVEYQWPSESKKTSRSRSIVRPH